MGYDAIYTQLLPLLDRLPQHNRSTLDTILEHLAKWVGPNIGGGA